MNALCRVLPAALLALVLVACGDGGTDPGEAADAAPAGEALPAVDPAELDQDVQPDPEAELPAVPEWQPVLPELAAPGLDKALAEAPRLGPAGSQLVGL